MSARFRYIYSEIHHLHMHIAHSTHSESLDLFFFFKLSDDSNIFYSQVVELCGQGNRSRCKKVQGYYSLQFWLAYVQPHVFETQKLFKASLRLIKTASVLFKTSLRLFQSHSRFLKTHATMLETLYDFTRTSFTLFKTCLRLIQERIRDSAKPGLIRVTCLVMYRGVKNTKNPD